MNQAECMVFPMMRRTENALAFMNTISEAGYNAMLYAGKNELEGNSQWNTDDIEGTVSCVVGFI